VILEAHTNKVLHQIVLTKRVTRKWKDKTIVIHEGNYEGTSKGMEGEAFRQILDWLEAQLLLPYFKVMCCDQDSSVLHQLKTDPRTKHVQVVHDPC